MSRLARLLLLAALVAGNAPAQSDRDVAFFRAAAVDNDYVVRRLLAEGIDPNVVDPVRRETALVAAVRNDADRVAALLLQARGIDLEAQAPNGDTALMLAAYKGKRELVAALIDRKAEVNRPGWTALHYAAASGHADIVRLLLEHHAYIDAASPNRTTPLMMAALGGHLATVRLLLDEGADAALRNDAGLNAFDFARQNNHREVADLLLARTRRFRH